MVRWPGWSRDVESYGGHMVEYTSSWWAGATLPKLEELDLAVLQDAKIKLSSIRAKIGRAMSATPYRRHKEPLSPTKIVPSPRVAEALQGMAVSARNSPWATVRKGNMKQRDKNPSVVAGFSQTDEIESRNVKKCDKGHQHKSHLCDPAVPPLQRLHDSQMCLWLTLPPP
ncbi:hypothetical protein RRG08_003711 [Elysia crispata]|uniref:Uncharacterized protein n=1 Tax=Elysia crispata TaxID=231223 RepID=A0AAE1AXB9_9GAST|nr:hypothetical protein RRG08_003711 [Elysia crispata]